MSAACAPETAPIVTAATNSLRIETTPIEHSELGADHRLLTLINRCRRRVDAKQNGAEKSRAVGNR